MIAEGQLKVDQRTDRGTSRRRVMPFLVFGAGLMHHRETYGGAAFSAREFAGSAGGGVRLQLDNAVFVAPEIRLAWQLHWRSTVVVGWNFGR